MRHICMSLTKRKLECSLYWLFNQDFPQGMLSRYCSIKNVIYLETDETKIYLHSRLFIWLIKVFVLSQAALALPSL